MSVMWVYRMSGGGGARGRDRRRIAADAGFSLMEAVVAGAILAMTAVIVAGLLISSLGLTRDNTRRTVGANIAAQQIERIRATRALDITDGLVTLPAVVAQGTTYKVVQEATYTQLNSTNSTCSSGSSADLAYKLVRITVTWPNMGSIKPIRSDTLRALGFGADDLDATQGALAVQVQGDQGRLISGISVGVKLSGGSTVTKTLVTDADGCVVFTGLDAGNYVALVDQSGYVNPDGVQSVSSSVIGVNPQQVSKATIPYDLTGVLVMTPTSPGSFPVPAGVTMTLTTSKWAAPTVRTLCPLGAPGCFVGSASLTAPALYPANYGGWAGSCIDARLPPVPITKAVTGGGTSTSTVSMADLTITATGITQPLYAVHAKESGGCAAGTTLSLGTPVAGTLRAALPYGTWKISTVSAPPSSAASVGTKGWIVLGALTTPYLVVAITT